MRLTPFHEGWGWGSRCIEIVAYTLSIIILGPLRLIHAGLDWFLSKVSA